MNPNSGAFVLRQLHGPHVPDKGLLDGIGEFCEALAAEHDGTFDGWEASRELDEGQEPTLPSSVTRH